MSTTRIKHREKSPTSRQRSPTPTARSGTLSLESRQPISPEIPEMERPRRTTRNAKGKRAMAQPRGRSPGVKGKAVAGGSKRNEMDEARAEAEAAVSEDTDEEPIEKDNEEEGHDATDDIDADDNDQNFKLKPMDIVDSVPDHDNAPKVPWAVLTIVPGSQEGRNTVCYRDHLTIGRSSTCDIQLSDQRLSSRHCVFFHSDNGFFVKDRSRNGIFLNGKRIQQDCAPIMDGDVVALIVTTYNPKEYIKFRFRCDPEYVNQFVASNADPVSNAQPGEADPASSASGEVDLASSAQPGEGHTSLTTTFARVAIEGASSSSPGGSPGPANRVKNVHYPDPESPTSTSGFHHPSKHRRHVPENPVDSQTQASLVGTAATAPTSWARLRALNPKHQDIMLIGDTTVLGRQTLLPEQLRHEIPYVSYHHCSILRQADGAYLRDASYNGTFLNGEKLKRGELNRIEAGDEIVLLYDDVSEVEGMSMGNGPHEVEGYRDRRGNLVEVGYALMDYGW